MIINVLASGSSGNAIFVSDGSTNLLLDAGLSYPKLRELHDNLSGLNGVLISHEHNDHCAGVQRLADRGVRVYMSEGTYITGGFRYSPWLAKISANREFRIHTFTVLPFRVQHDAAEPLGFLLLSEINDTKILYIVDAGEIPARFQGLNYILVECNYSEELLTARDDIPDSGKARIRKTHLSLEQIKDFLKETDTSELYEVMLIHMSADSANKKQFKNEIQGQIGLPVSVY